MTKHEFKKQQKNTQTIISFIKINECNNIYTVQDVFCWFENMPTNSLTLLFNRQSLIYLPLNVGRFTDLFLTNRMQKWQYMISSARSRGHVGFCLNLDSLNLGESGHQILGTLNQPCGEANTERMLKGPEHCPNHQYQLARHLSESIRKNRKYVNVM